MEKLTGSRPSSAGGFSPVAAGPPNQATSSVTNLARSRMMEALRLALGAPWLKPIVWPVRCVVRPAWYLVNKVVSGDWVPSGPWMMVGIALSFASSVQEYKRVAGHLLRLLFAREGAACDLCHSIMPILLHYDEGDADEIHCEEICWGMKACMGVCQRVIGALASSAEYPCITVGLCPDVDELDCTYTFPIGCEPRSRCQWHAGVPRPKCALRPVFAQWSRWRNVVSKNAEAFATAVARRSYCGAEGSDAFFCITESSGVGRLFEITELVLIAIALVCSIHAVETPGEKDDKQWLTVWIVLFCLASVERVTDVLLSRFNGIYHLAKLFLIVVLLFFHGAARLYSGFGTTFRRLAQFLEWIDAKVPQIELFRMKLGTTMRASTAIPWRMMRRVMPLLSAASTMARGKGNEQHRERSDEERCARVLRALGSPTGSLQRVPLPAVEPERSPPTPGPEDL